MASFDFITNGEFRSSLESDYSELRAALQARAFKSVHVLAGSIIEAVLIDYLIAINYQSRSQKDPLKMTLEKLIEACKDEKIISERVSDLSTVIRSYRNLIHPARIVRLNENVDENTATVAQAVVEMVVSEIAKQKKATYGYTAEQIVDKLERDPSVSPILGDILKETREVELEKLLELIPQKHLELTAFDNYGEDVYRQVVSMEICFRLAFNVVSSDIKKRVVEKYVGIIKNASENEISTYGNAFFISRDIGYLGDADKELVKKHIFHRLGDILYNSPKVLEGIGRYLNESDVVAFTDDIVKAITSTNSQASEVRKLVIEEYYNMKTEVKEIFKKRLDVWIRYDSQKAHKLHKIEEFKNALLDIEDDEIPF
jgi:hypothetical protein